MQPTHHSRFTSVVRDPPPSRTTSPRISVITVCYNARMLVTGTLSSIKQQDYPNTELVVVDGASTDGTRELLRDALSRDDVFVSEPDNGIYDAMNKGLSLASGQWVLFLNAGDSFVSPHVLREVSASLNSECALVYGGVVTVGSGATRHLHFQEPVRWRIVRNICHQVILYNRAKLQNMLRFDTKYRICADFELLVRVLEQFGTRGIRRVQIPIANYLLGGLSDTNRSARIAERLAILKRSRLPLLTKVLSIGNSYRHALTQI